MIKWINIRLEGYGKGKGKSKSKSKKKLNKMVMRKLLHQIDCKFGFRFKDGGWKQVLNNLKEHRRYMYVWVAICPFGKDMSADYHENKEEWESYKDGIEADEAEVWLSWEEFMDLDIQMIVNGSKMNLL